MYFFSTTCRQVQQDAPRRTRRHTYHNYTNTNGDASDKHEIVSNEVEEFVAAGLQKQVRVEYIFAVCHL